MEFVGLTKEQEAEARAEIRKQNSKKVEQQILEENEREEKEAVLQKVYGFTSFEEVLKQYPNAIDLSNSEKKSWSYKEVEQYLKSIVNDSFVTLDGDNIGISDNYEHIETSSEYKNLNRRGKEEIKTYAAEIKKLINNSEYEKEIINKDSSKQDVEKFRYYSVPVWINNRAYNVLLECGVLKENEPLETQACKEASNEHVTKGSNIKYIRKSGKLQVADISYLYNLKNRPLYKKVEQQEKTIQKQNQLLYGETKVEVNGVTRICPNGIVEGFAKSVSRNDEQNQRIIRQNQKIENLNNYIDSITNTKDSINPNKPEPKDPKSPGDDGMSF